MTDETYSYAIVRAAGERFDVVECEDGRRVRVVRAGLADVGCALVHPGDGPAGEADEPLAGRRGALGVTMPFLQRCGLALDLVFGAASVMTEAQAREYRQRADDTSQELLRQVLELTAERDRLVDDARALRLREIEACVERHAAYRDAATARALLVDVEAWMVAQRELGHGNKTLHARVRAAL